MDIKDFSETKTGELLPVRGGAPDAAFAFNPDPLPPAWEWPLGLWNLLLEARTALASLDGTGKHLPNPEILLRPLQAREAQLSSQLEGTITDPQQQALFQVDPRYPTSAQDPVNAYREVFNYGKALRARIDGSEDLPLSLRLIRNLHAILMDGVRGSNQQPGEFRSMQNQIGRPARFVPPPPKEMSQALHAFETYLHQDGDFDPLVRAFLAHYQFETIHPFGDGNGRVGRLLLSLCIAEWCGLSRQWLYMSPYFEINRVEYMDLMLGVSTHGRWEEWISFCLKGVREQAKDTERRCEKLLNLHREFHKKISTVGSRRLFAIVDNLFENAVTTVTRIKEAHGVAYATAKSDLQKLVTLGILRELSQPVSGLRTYYCQPIYQIIYEGAQLK